jgi:hypothetical protein
MNAYIYNKNLRNPICLQALTNESLLVDGNIAEFAKLYDFYA